MKRSVLMLVITLGLAQSAMADPAVAPALPDDPRLSSARAELDGLVAQLAAEGLPADMIVTKVREGLAKHVPVARILVVARKLGVDLVDVDSLARSNLRLGADRAPPGLLAALIDAKSAGVSAKELAALLGESAKDKGKGNPAAVATRAATTLADLSARGYPTPGAGAVVGALARGDGRKLGRLISALETLRRAEGLTQAQAFEALRGALANGADPDKAVKQASAAGTRGKSIAPGQNKTKSKGPRR